MTLLDETFNVAPEFFFEYLDGVIEKIRAVLFLLLPGEFCLVPVPFSKPNSYQDRENGRVYESYQDIFPERIKKLDIVLENSAIGYILIEHRKTDFLRVRIFPYGRIKEKGPNGKLYPGEGPNILKQLVKDINAIEPGHPLQLPQSEKPRSVLEVVKKGTELTTTEKLCIKWAGRDRSPRIRMEEFLDEFIKDVGSDKFFITKEQFKKALNDCEKKGLIRKVNGRYVINNFGFSEIAS